MLFRCHAVATREVGTGQLADGILAPGAGLPVSEREVEGLFAPMTT